MAWPYRTCVSRWRAWLQFSNLRSTACKQRSISTETSSQPCRYTSSSYSEVQCLEKARSTKDNSAMCCAVSGLHGCLTKAPYSPMYIICGCCTSPARHSLLECSTFCDYEAQHSGAIITIHRARVASLSGFPAAPDQRYSSRPAGRCIFRSDVSSGTFQSSWLMSVHTWRDIICGSKQSMAAQTEQLAIEHNC
jgi:hypothetical protein